MTMEEQDKVYFNPGDIVIVKHEELENRPIMLVTDTKKSHFSNEEMVNTKIGMRKFNRPTLKGIVCRQFNANGSVEEAIFNTKDLKHI